MSDFPAPETLSSGLSIQAVDAVLEQHKHEWETLGRLDPLWAVLTEPKGKFGKWDVTEFFKTGETLICDLLGDARSLRVPTRWRRALDFGCGVGRLTRALSSRFEECYGVDVSSEMVARAQQLNANLTNCEFLVNAEANLNRFPSGHFDFVVTAIVLQHLPSRAMIRSYLSELIRVLAQDGLLIFQLPHNIRIRNRMQLRRKLYCLLKAVGVPEVTLYRNLTLNPIRMNFIHEQAVNEFVAKCGASVVRVRHDRLPTPAIDSRTYFVSKAW